MKQQTFIFIGRSGCGKGTQSDLLMDLLRKKQPEAKILYIQTGQEFRQFIQGDTITQKEAKKVYDSGGLMPEFLAIYQWVRILVEKYTGIEHILFDGTPRKIHEAGILNSIFGFYNLGKPWVIHVEVSGEEAFNRLMKRKRDDDTEEDIKERLSWYEKEVMPTIEYYKNNPNYNYLKINGEKPIDEIHEDIAKKVGLI